MLNHREKLEQPGPGTSWQTHRPPLYKTNTHDHCYNAILNKLTRSPNLFILTVYPCSSAWACAPAPRIMPFHVAFKGIILTMIHKSNEA